MNIKKIISPISNNKYKKINLSELRLNKGIYGKSHRKCTGTHGSIQRKLFQTHRGDHLILKCHGRSTVVCAIYPSV